MHTNKPTCKGDKGFTLVELAIVMIIIGLLLGGVLKGQELITNAQVAATVTAVKGIDAATTTFRDSYGALPGDMSNATTRLSNCTGICIDGNGDGMIGSSNVAYKAVDTATENYNYFVHLNRAELINAGSGNGDLTAFGPDLPSAPVGGGFAVTYTSNGKPTGLIDTTDIMHIGHYLLLRAGAPNSTATYPLGAKVTSRIDAKMDDGAPNTGSLRATGKKQATTGCADGGVSTSKYTIEGTGCGLYIHIQQ